MSTNAPQGESSSRRRRSYADICASIIKVLRAEDLTMDKIVVHANLNRRLAKRYVGKLVTNGSIEASKSRPVHYSATAKGIEWYRKYVSVITELKS